MHEDDNHAERTQGGKNPARKLKEAKRTGGPDGFHPSQVDRPLPMALDISRHCSLYATQTTTVYLVYNLRRSARPLNCLYGILTGSG